LDGDGDLDVGTNGTDSVGKWVGRIGAQGYATLSNGTDEGFSLRDVSQPVGQEEQGFTPNGSPAPDAHILNTSTSEFRVGTLRFTVTGSGGVTNVNFIRRPFDDPGANLWFEDGSATGKFPGAAGGGTMLNGADVVIQIPEPASIGLLGIAGLGLLARRKKNA
jgi:hypothetical protein